VSSDFVIPFGDGMTFTEPLTPAQEALLAQEDAPKVQRRTSAQSTAPGVSWKRINLAAAELAIPPEPPSLCGLVYRGKRHAISGPPESAKTLLAWIIALHAMREENVAVAALDFEMGALGTRRLLDDLGATIDEIASIYYVEPDRPPSAEDIGAIVGNGIGLVIIDAAAGAFDVSELDDGKRKDVEAFARAWIRPLWTAGVTTILIDHVTKNAETRGRYAIGSERKIGAADVHIGLEDVKSLTRGSTGLVKVRAHKDRAGFLHRPYAAELQLTSDPDTNAISWAFRPASSEGDNGWQPTVLMEKVSRYLEQQAEPVSRNTVESKVTGQGTYKREAMDALVADGYAVEAPGPRKARMLVSIKPFRTSSDLVATSSDTVALSDLVSSSPPYRGTRSDEDEVDTVAKGTK
jgi:hypothetical protein